MYQTIGDNGNHGYPSSHFPLPSSIELRKPAERGYPLIAFIVISSLAACAGVLCLICIILTFIDQISIINIFFQLFELYGAAFCCLVVLTELDLIEPIRASPLLQSWVFRGVLYIFIALFVVEVDLKFAEESTLTYATICFSSSFMGVIGIVYFIMVSTYA